MHGVPYGARARMILLYLQTQAIRTGNREVELGRSMRDWLGRMGLSIGGETAKALREQAARISACGLKFFFWDGEDGEGWSWGGIFLRPALQSGDGGRSGQLVGRSGRAGRGLLRRAPRPSGAVTGDSHPRVTGSHLKSLDLYVWLAYRLHTLDQPDADRLGSSAGPIWCRLPPGVPLQGRV